MAARAISVTRSIWKYTSFSTGFQQFRALMNVETPEREVGVNVQEAVDTFLRAFGGRLAPTRRKAGKVGTRQGKP